MSCCKQSMITIEQLKKIASKYSRIKELKKFCYILTKLEEDNKDIIFYRLCNERIEIYNKYDNSTEKIQKYLDFCNVIIRVVQYS